MKQLIFSLLLFIPYYAFAQEKGIQFEHGIWNEVVQKAAKENKLIYVDFYTTWCGPCKFMSSTLFVDEKVGEFYNKNFVCYKVDAEKGEGIGLAKKYNVTGYPTNVFISMVDKKSKLVYKTIGSPLKPEELIKNGQIALEEFGDPMSYKEYENKFISNKYDNKFLKKFIIKNNHLSKNNNKYLDEYIRINKNKENDTIIFNLIRECSESRTLLAKGNSFNFLCNLKKSNAVDTAMVNDEISSIVYATVENAIELNNENEFEDATNLMTKYYENGYELSFDDKDKFYTKNKNNLKLINLYNEYGNYFSKITDEEIFKRDNFQFEKGIETKKRMMKLMQGSVPESADSMLRRTMKLSHRDKVISTSYANNLNSICWNVFEKLPTNKQLVNASINWIQRAMKLSEYSAESWCGIADTYAHLLNLQGEKIKAKNLEKEILEKAKQNNMEDLKPYEDFLKELEK